MANLIAICCNQNKVARDFIHSLYPDNSMVLVLLGSTQNKPSLAKVVYYSSAHTDPGYIRVCLVDTPGKSFRNIPYGMIVGLA